MRDLALWLTAQLDEDARIVREANTSPEMVTGIPRSYAVAPVALHIAEFADPARVLREIEAKREIVEQHVPVGDGTVCLSYCHTRTPGEAQVWPCLTLRLLALSYSDRPGYREEWKPVRLYRAGAPGVIDYEEAP